MEWFEKSKEQERNAIQKFIVKEIALYKEIYPSLKLMIGESFAPDHWNDLIRILKIKKTPIERLQFGAILD